MVPSNLLLLAHDLDPKAGTHFSGSCAGPGSMTESKPTARARIAPAGLLFLAITSVGWGFNWPVTKYLLSEVPPLTLRGVTGVIGALLLAALALVRRENLKVGEEGQWPRLVLAAFLNVTGWMVLMGLALLWLPASEAALIAYTMPVWASLIAWPVLGERPTVLRTIALCGALGFALGTVFSKKYPIHLPPITAAAWQIGIGCLPISIIGLMVETTHLSRVTPVGWWLLLYS